VREVRRSGLVASISGSTLWRWLHQDAIRPWYHRSWIFPRDPDFAEKAGRLLDLYARQWQSKPLRDDEFVISADEKTSIQARVRKHPTRSCRPRRSMRVEHAYQRGGAWVYLSALDVHNARVFGRCETKNGIAPFDRLVEQVMTRPPYNDAIHAPIHASWLNQVEIYFSIVQRKVLTPNDFSDLDAVADRLLDFQYYWEATARPFEWTFTRDDLKNLLDKFEQQGTLR
jgi:hypothetical protein